MNDDDLYAALIACDPAFDGFVFVGVTSTGVFCRLTCPARKPKRENTLFFDSAQAAIKGGFRSCKRCLPLAPRGESEPIVKRLLDLLRAEAPRRWTEQDLRRLGLDPSTVRRVFLRRFGQTFLSMARNSRLGRGALKLDAGSTVIDAQLEAGFQSRSGFRAAIVRQLGNVSRSRDATEDIQARWIETPIGALLAVADPDRLLLLKFFDDPGLAQQLMRLQQAKHRAIRVDDVSKAAPLRSIQNEIELYFSQGLPRFITPAAQLASEFGRKFESAVCSIDFGQTRSLADVARHCRTPAAYRAVANAARSNSLILVVPTHRVVSSRSDGHRVESAFWRQRWLITHEHRLNNPNNTEA